MRAIFFALGMIVGFFLCVILVNEVKGPAIYKNGVKAHASGKMKIEVVDGDTVVLPNMPLFLWRSDSLDILFLSSQ